MQNLIDQSNNIASNQDNELNIFDILPQDDPEVVSLLAHLNQSDFAVEFLPQISFNTYSKLLDEQIELTKEESENKASSVFQIVQLKNECETPEQQASPVPVDSVSEQSGMSVRTSQRLMNKKDTKWSRNEGLVPKSSKKGKKHETRSTALKRKRSQDDDDDSYNSSENDSIDYNKNSSKRFVTKHNDNSVDFESDDHIYYDDDDDDEIHENDNDYFHSDDDDNEKDFKNYVRNYNLMNRGRTGGNRIDPTKKESNKEAATRYRLKKLSEKDRLFQTRMCLENENNEVKRKIEMASTEINYLKSLLVQMLLTKGTLSV